MWGTTSPSAKLTDDSGSAFEALLIGDCRLFRSLAENLSLRLLGLLQQYLPTADSYFLQSPTRAPFLNAACLFYKETTAVRDPTLTSALSGFSDLIPGFCV